MNCQGKEKKELDNEANLHQYNCYKTIEWFEVIQKSIECEDRERERDLLYDRDRERERDLLYDRDRDEDNNVANYSQFTIVF